MLQRKRDVQRLVDAMGVFCSKLRLYRVFMYWRDGYWPVDNSSIGSLIDFNDSGKVILGNGLTSPAKGTGSRNPLQDSTNRVRLPCKCM